MLQSDRTIRLELKYCERCGSLWFRVKESEQSFCDPCMAIEPEIARRHRDAARARKVGESPRFASLANMGHGTDDWFGPMTNVVTGPCAAMHTKEAACAY